MIKYIKVEDATEPMEGLELGKVLLDTSDENGGPETPWVKIMSDGRQVLQNHAINFHPFPSWGMVLPAGEALDITAIRDAKEFPLHPEAWQSYLEEGMIDEEGNFVTPAEKPAADA